MVDVRRVEFPILGLKLTLNGKVLISWLQNLMKSNNYKKYLNIQGWVFFSNLTDFSFFPLK